MKLLVFILFSFPLWLMAQNKPLIVEGVYPGLYVTHVVGPKENYYSIGRIYNVSPKEIAPFNNLELEKGLSLHQSIKIPLLATNFLQEGNAAEGEVLVPVYHTVENKEGLYRISTNYNKVPVENIVKWNNLKSPTVSNGTNLIVGYLKVKKELSPLAATAKDKPTDVISKAENPVKTDNTVKTVTEKPAEKLGVAAPPVVKEKQPEIISEPAKSTPDPVVIKEEKGAVKAINVSTASKSFTGGVFKSEFEKQVKSKKIVAESGEAATFKSTSGWQDGKYYCLHNGSTPGTIIKITNNTTGKNVYAKVLDAIPDMQQNSGLLIRLSNAAADELGAGESPFNCTLSYPK